MAPAPHEPVHLEPPPDPRPKARPPGKTPFTRGTYLGLFGKVLYLIAIFMPWYVVAASVNAGDYSTDGWVNLVTIDGLKGIQINELLTGGAIPRPVSFLPVPLSWILLFFFGWSVFSIVRARTARRRGWKFIRGGLVILIIFGVIYLMVSRLPSMVPAELGDLREIIAYVASSPRGGMATRTFGIYGSVKLKWGVQIGGYMLFISAILQLMGGMGEFGHDRR